MHKVYFCNITTGKAIYNNAKGVILMSSFSLVSITGIHVCNKCCMHDTYYYKTTSVVINIMITTLTGKYTSKKIVLRVHCNKCIIASTLVMQSHIQEHYYKRNVTCDIITCFTSFVRLDT